MKKLSTILMSLFLLCVMAGSVLAANTDADAKERAKIERQQAKEQAKAAKAKAKAEKEQAKIIKERGQIDELSEKALARLYAKVPSSQRVIEESYAYATLSNTGMKLGLFGDAHGRGVAINKATGEKVYLRMNEMGIGVGLGVKEYDLVFVISTEDAWKSFTAGNVKFATSAEASASDGKAGAALEGASIAARGIWVYQLTKKGMALDASIKGTKIYPYKKLNKDLEQPEEVK